MIVGEPIFRLMFIVLAFIEVTFSNKENAFQCYIHYNYTAGDILIKNSPYQMLFCPSVLIANIKDDSQSSFI